jgi:hypothetical protein
MSTKPEENLGDPLPTINPMGCMDALSEMLEEATAFVPRPIVTVEAPILHGDRIVIEEREHHTEVFRLRRDGTHAWLTMLKYQGAEEGLRYALREIEKLRASAREEG